MTQSSVHFSLKVWLEWCQECCSFDIGSTELHVKICWCTYYTVPRSNDIKRVQTYSAREVVDLLFVFVCVCLCRKLCMSLLQVGLAHFCLIMALHGCGISSSATWMHWCHAVVPKFRFGVITDDVEITHLLEQFQSSIWTLFCLNAFKLTFLVLESACCHNKACSCCIFLQL